MPYLFPVYKETNSVLVLIYSISSVAIVYIVCSLIDRLRQGTVEKLWIIFLNNYLDNIEKSIRCIVKKVSHKITSLLQIYYNQMGE